MLLVVRTNSLVMGKRKLGFGCWLCSRFFFWDNRWRRGEDRVGPRAPRLAWTHLVLDEERVAFAMPLAARDSWGRRRTESSDKGKGRVIMEMMQAKGLHGSFFFVEEAA